jgi:hypothetical protein
MFKYGVFRSLEDIRPKPCINIPPYHFVPRSLILSHSLITKVRTMRLMSSGMWRRVVQYQVFV